MMDTLAKVSDAIIKETETSHTDNNRVESLTKEMEEVKNHLKKQQNSLDKTQDQLALILSLLQREK